MLRWLTAGESHGRALVAVCEGLPAGIEVSTADVAAALARRRAGYGRGARMKFEQDETEITGGQPLADRDERAPVRFPGGQPAQHDADPPTLGRAVITSRRPRPARPR